MNSKLSVLKNKISDHMLLGAVYDTAMKKMKYNVDSLPYLYSVMVGQKHRMLYYKKLKKRYLNSCTSDRSWEKKDKVFHKDIIWFCWLQGIDQAPLIVKRCYESLQKNVKNKKIIVVDENNLFDYIRLPEYIMDKWKRGIIGMAHFSDLIRLELLRTHGGYWIDSTVLCTNGDLLNYIDDESLFMYSWYYFGFNAEIMTYNNWFMYSTTNNNVLCLVQEFLYQYWRDYDRSVDYFIFQLFMTMAVDYYEDEGKRMPIVSQVDSHVLATYIFEPFDEKKYDMLKASAGFHKLSTRFNEQEKSQKNTFYDVIVNQGRI